MRLGLTVRDLATLAGVAYPTISRIENGHESPRWTTVERILDALGVTLGVNGPSRLDLSRLADLSDAWAVTPGGSEQPDWTRLRAFADHLSLRPAHTGALIADRPLPSGSLFIDNLLAGIAEKSADDAGIRRPAWTAACPPLRRRWEAPGTPRMQRENQQATPPQFKARCITLPASAVWREHRLVAT